MANVFNNISVIVSVDYVGKVFLLEENLSEESDDEEEISLPKAMR